MKQLSGRQKRVLSLIDGYQSDFGGEYDEHSKQGQLSRVIRELRRYPGHWFLIGQVTKVGRVVTRAGARAIDLKAKGYETAEVDGKQYARLQAGGRTPLAELITRPDKRRMTSPLPAVTSDRFGWSRDELQQAKATARAWLFPIEGIAA